MELREEPALTFVFIPLLFFSILLSEVFSVSVDGSIPVYLKGVSLCHDTK